MSEEFGPDFITITDEDGNDIELELVDALEHNGQTYMAFFPAVEEGNEDDEEEYGLVILKSIIENGEEMLSTLDGVALAQRVTVDSVKNVNIAKKAIKKAFQNQIEGKGYSIVEVLSTCPTNWGMSPVDSLKWLQENMIPYYPLGVFKDGEKGDRLK